MSYQFDTTQLQTANVVKTIKTERPVRILSRRNTRALRREIRSF